VSAAAGSTPGCGRGWLPLALDQASGTLAKRAALDKALDYLREGDALVITKPGRLGRSVRNLKTLADDLQTRQVGLRALSQGIDTTNPEGRLFFHMLAAIAEFEHDLIVERTQDGLAAARARGRKGGPKFKMTPTAPAKPGPCTTPANTPCRRSPTPSGSPDPPSTGTLPAPPLPGP